MTYDPATYWPRRYDEQGETYVAEGGREASYRAQMRELAPYLEHLPFDGRILDFGCGPGRFRQLVEARGAAYEGFDLIPGLGTIGEERIRAERESFAGAMAIFVLQHIVGDEEYDYAVRLLHTALAPGGVLLVVDAEPVAGKAWAAHMRPRGFGALRDAAIWTEADVVGRYNGHWIGVFER